MVRLCVAAACMYFGASALRTKRTTEEELRAYSFEHFVEAYGRQYKTNTHEYNQRAKVFEDSMAQIVSKNLRAGKLYTAGVHPFMDWTSAERKSLHGYKPSRARAPVFSALQLNTTFYGAGGDSFLAPGPPVREQGNCGSCWAISAVEAIEAQLMKSGTNMQLSPQALVDCVQNPRHCGGAGGCDGATGELAYSFVREHGIPTEEDWSYNAKDGSCPLTGLGSNKNFPTAQRVRLSGWNTLPSNQAQPLMQALVQQGPAVVAVDANDWFDYSNGIYDGCHKDATLVHAVLAKGYGQESGSKYWQIQNSWGKGWGENGDIRIVRHDDEDQWCGTDSKPEQGLGCDGGPKEITVCGTCGLLYDPLIPQGVHVETGDSVAAITHDEALAEPASTAAPEPAPQADPVLLGPDTLPTQPENVVPVVAAESPQQSEASLPAVQSDAEPAKQAGSTPSDEMRKLLGISETQMF